MLIRTALTSLVVLFCSTVHLHGATPEEVDNAIRRGREYLLSQQKEGTWETWAQGATNDSAVWSGGRTALATTALIVGGESVQDERIAKAVDFLRTADIRGVYSVSLRAQIWPLLPPTPEVRDAAARDAGLLSGSMRSRGEAEGMYSYFVSDPYLLADQMFNRSNDYDHSNSQFAALGLWACVQAGVEVAEQNWRRIDQGWRRHQLRDGGWGYKANKDATVSMTAAGLATLLIAQEFVQPDAGINCSSYRDMAIERAVSWLGSHHPTSSYVLYTLYGISRIGVAGGYKYLGDHDWFAEGAELLVRKQSEDGSWQGGGSDPICGTSFAILFLARGRAPVIFNKLQYNMAERSQRAGDWNQRPRDIAHLTRWLSKQTERHLNWQIVDLNQPVDELFEAPLLYISGDKSFYLGERERTKLRQFIEGGGLVLGNANCGSKAFADSFRKLGKQLFPTYEFRELPSDHVIYTGQIYPRTKWKSFPVVFGLNNGARELMLLIPSDDAGKNWQLRNEKVKPELHQLAMNIVRYATDQQDFRYKGTTHIVRRNPNRKALHETKVARLRYAGNWDPEPEGWRRLDAISHNRFDWDIEVTNVRLGEGKLTTDFKAAHLTGTTHIDLTAEQVAELKKYVEGGGTLIVDACGGTVDAGTSLENLLGAMFPEQAKHLASPMAPNHPLFRLRDDPNAQVGYRRFAKTRVGNLRQARLRGLELNGRMAVFFSPEDLSVGLVGQNVDGIDGYDPASAVDCMLSMLQHAAGNTLVRPMPATAPEPAPATLPTTTSGSPETPPQP